jgi:hypothetical protein
MAKKPEEKREEVREEELTIRRTEIPVLVEPGVWRTQLAITFYSDTIPPMTIFMWKDEWSKEKELEEIKKAIERAAKPSEEKVKIRFVKS